SPFTIPGHPVPQGQEPSAHVTSLSPGTLDVFRMVVARGRAFTAKDDSTSMLVALVDQTMAQRYWPGENPIGKKVKIGFYTQPIQRERGGCVPDQNHTALRPPAGATVYLPMAQAPTGSLWLMMHTAIEPTALAHDVKRIAAELDPTMPIAGITSFDQLESETL